jgi:hypothetical protein
VPFAFGKDVLSHIDCLESVSEKQNISVTNVVILL